MAQASQRKANAAPNKVAAAEREAARIIAAAEERARGIIEDARASADGVRAEGMELVSALRSAADSLHESAERRPVVRRQGAVPQVGAV